MASSNSDLNDLHKIKGAEAVKATIELAASPESIAKADKKKPRGKSSKGSSVASFDADGRHIITHDAGKLPEIVDALGAALADADDLNLFIHGGRLVRAHAASDKKIANISRPKGALILHSVDAAHLTELAGRAALHQKFDSRTEEYRKIDCPRRIPEAYLSRGHHPELNTLTGVIEAPGLSPEFRLIDKAGYDSETGLFASFEAIAGYKRPSVLTQAAAKKAAERLQDALVAFPFVDDADCSAAVAGIITSLVRRILPAAPMFAITAPTAGTGKSLLATTFPLISTGRFASVLSLGHDEAESEKRLAGVLLAGDSAILLDNIERALSGDLLCQILTQPSVRLRPLGGSGMVSVPTNSMLLATGNNLSILGDLKRRVALIRLDAREERPEQRKFSNDHLADIFKNRGKLIADALLIPLAYASAGLPAVEGLFPLGGFSEWDAMVRRPLVWLGLDDPMLASETLRQNDPDHAAMQQLFTSWHDAFGDAQKTVAEVCAAGADGLAALAIAEQVRSELRDALQLVCAEKPNSRRLGYWLRKHRDRITDGLQLSQGGLDGDSRAAKWRISKC